MATHEVFLGLGSNVGEKELHIKRAHELINSQIGQIISSSSLYITKPWGKPDQSDFINQAVRVLTDLGPQTLLAKIQEIEATIGRVRDVQWGPRTIDIDILYYGKMILDIEGLQLPHSELTERKFVLVPLTEIAPDFIHPIFKLSNKELLDFCEDKLEVQKC